MPRQRCRPAYDEASLHKLYVDGHFEGIRSLRKLACVLRGQHRSTPVLREVMPDYRTVARFRRDNVTLLKQVFWMLTKRLLEGLDPGFCDG